MYACVYVHVCTHMCVGIYDKRCMRACAEVLVLWPGLPAKFWKPAGVCVCSFCSCSVLSFPSLLSTGCRVHREDKVMSVPCRCRLTAVTVDCGSNGSSSTGACLSASDRFSVSHYLPVRQSLLPFSSFPWNNFKTTPPPLPRALPPREKKQCCVGKMYSFEYTDIRK
jgi:hypothetical protein